MFSQARIAVAGILLLGLAGCTSSEAEVDGPKTGSSSRPPQSNGVVPEVAVPAGSAEYQQAILSCMQGRGWDGSISADSIQFDPSPVEQRSQFEADIDECGYASQSSAPIDAPLSDALFELNYSRAKAAVDCYDDAGFPHEKLGSFQVWRQDFESGRQFGVSSLVQANLSGGGATLSRAEASCPDPSAFFFDPVTPLYDDVVSYEDYRSATGG